MTLMQIQSILLAHMPTLIFVIIVRIYLFTYEPK